MTLVIFELVLFFVMISSVMCQQPLSLGGFLLVLSFLFSVYVSIFFSSWFSFSVYLIYVGGLLVLFGYVMVLIPNFIFSVKGYFFYFFIFLFFFYFFCLGNIGYFCMDFAFSFFSLSNFVVYLGLGLVLFIGLVSVAKICFFQIGALRPFLFY